MSCMSLRKNIRVKLLCIFLLLLSLSALKSVTGIGFSDPENDVWHSLTGEKIEWPGIDVINVYTYGSSIVVECLNPIPIEDPIPLDFLVLFSNDDDESNWEAAIHVRCLDVGNRSANWVIGDLAEVTIFDWNLDPIGTHFSFFENKLTMFFTEFDDVSTSALSVEVTAELKDDMTQEFFILKDWAPDHYQPPDFEVPGRNDTTTTTTTTEREEPTTTESTSDMSSTTSGLTNLSWFPIFLSVPLITYLYKRRKGF